MAQFFGRVLVVSALLTSTTGLPEICHPGVYDCEYPSRDATAACAPYDGEYPDPQGDPALLVLGCIVAAVMAFGIGGNDSANSWGTSVGSGAVSLRKACLLGGLGELLGATLLGAGVSSTIQKGVVPVNDPDCWACGFCDSRMAIYQFGMMSASAGAALFLLLVTGFSIPIATSQAIVGGVLGMTLVGNEGSSCLSWSVSGNGLLRIVLSWAASPLLAGFIAVVMYLILDRAVLRAQDPAAAALRAVPLLFGLASAGAALLVLATSPIAEQRVPGVAKYLISTAVLFAVPLLVQLLVVPRTQWRVLAATEVPKPKASQVDSSTDVVVAVEAEVLAEEALMKRRRQAQEVFRTLLVFVAFLESFARGAGDAADATGPLSAIANTYKNGVLACSGESTPWWIMSVAGLCVALGMNVTGHRVIKTMGEEITDLNFVIAFCVEFASGSCVLLATFLGMPISTTQCQVGAVVFVGVVAHGVGKVSWSMFGKIVLTWLITLPFSGGLAAQLMWLRYHAV